MSGKAKDFPDEGPKRRVMVGAIGACVHNLGVEGFADWMEDKGLGYISVKLGPAVPIPEVINKVREARPEVVGVSMRLGDLESDERYFRPSAGGGVLAPGLLNQPAVDHLCAAGYSLVLWNAICEDWARPDGSWVEIALAEIGRNEWTLLVLHDIPGGGMAHLPRFLDALEELGIDVVAEMPPDLVPISCGRVVGSVDELVG